MSDEITNARKKAIDAVHDVYKKIQGVPEVNTGNGILSLINSVALALVQPGDKISFEMLKKAALVDLLNQKSEPIVLNTLLQMTGVELKYKKLMQLINDLPSTHSEATLIKTLLLDAELGKNKLTLTLPIIFSTLSVASLLAGIIYDAYHKQILAKTVSSLANNVSSLWNKMNSPESEEEQKDDTKLSYCHRLA